MAAPDRAQDKARQADQTWIESHLANCVRCGVKRAGPSCQTALMRRRLAGGPKVKQLHGHRIWDV
jgi:hypothetical protein